jgi:hypothetical protein
MPYVLSVWRKDNEEKIIAVSQDKKPLLEIATAIDGATGYKAGLGVWAQEKVPGYCRITEVKELDWKDAFHKALDFLRYKDGA